MYAIELKENNMKNVREYVIECSIRYGIKNTDFNMVAEKSGLNVRSIRRYYKNKADMFVDAIENYALRLYDDVCKEMKKSINSKMRGIIQLQEFLRKIGNVRIHGLPPWHMLCQLDSFIHEMGIKEYSENQLWKFDEIKSILIEIIDIGISDKSIITQIDAEDIADYILNSYIGLMARLSQFQYIGNQYNEKLMEKHINMYIESVIVVLNRETQN